MVDVRVTVASDTSANWAASSLVLAVGQLAWETDTGILRVGNGVSLEPSLPSVAGTGASTGTDAAVVNTIVRRDNNGGFAVPFIYGLSTPAAPDNATNKAYVDAANALKAPLASPALTGVPTAPTATAGTNSTQVATTAFVAAGLGGKVAGTATVTVGTTAPGSPAVGDLWVDTN